MNSRTVSVECSHGCHTACDFEDCTCLCHMPDDDDQFDSCPHGIGWDEECEACEADSESCGWRDVFDAGGVQ